MTDTDERKQLDEKHERVRERRIEGVKRWVEYIKSEPVDVWGPQQNAVVNSQLEAAQEAAVSVAHQQHVADVAADILAEQDDSA
ncbi:hypothetical protein [Halobacterium noricense]|uniref:hypothetical protein n=1 Tax=Halobacterium noricense TaxID=223182 RepID=UPI001E58C299|nr:hypothetical protein [Halobacterium noricense]UHH26630.1 hypothetical protein LT974_06765 [Halobacterium noricense]